MKYPYYEKVLNPVRRESFTITFEEKNVTFRLSSFTENIHKNVISDQWYLSFFSFLPSIFPHSSLTLLCIITIVKFFVKILTLNRVPRIHVC